MRLLLFRHGPAEARDGVRWPDDLLRPLSEQGARRTRRAALGVARLEPKADAVFSSPATRCLESARLLAAALLVPAEPIVLSSLAPGGAWPETLRRLAREDLAATIAVVGHEPDLALLTGALLGAEPASLAFKKAGACALEWDTPEPGRARLKWWLGPGTLRSLKPRRAGRVA